MAEKVEYITSDDFLPDAGAVEAHSVQTGGLQRKLKARHIQMIAIGSCIGTGLFVGSGKSLHSGGPLALVLGFIIISIALTFMMQCLGEMSVLIPVTGSFTRYTSRFLEPSLGFAVGWQYWLAWVAVFGAESSAFRLLINFWDPASNLTALWISIFVVITLAIHVSPVRVFGEVEFIVSCIKVVAIVVFLITIWAIMGGAGPNGKAHGAEYWHLPGLDNGLHNGFKGLGSVFVQCAFSCGGVEIVGIVAGETVNPRWTLPRAIKTTMWRIVLFYVMSTLFLTFVVPYTSPDLIGSGTNETNSSPFVIAIKDAGIKGLPSVLNAVILICVCSVGSSSIYICSRTLQAMGEDGFAPQIFTRTDKRGRPYVALLFSGAIGTVLAYLNCSSTGATVFGWFSSISGLAFFIAWMAIIACNWRFHAALKAQNDDALQKRFAYRAKFWPWPSMVAFGIFAFMVVCQFIVSVWPIHEEPSASTFFSNFLSVPIFLACIIGYKVFNWKNSKWQRLEDVDLKTGRRDDDESEIAVLEHYQSLPMYKRALSYFHF